MSEETTLEPISSSGEYGSSTPSSLTSTERTVLQETISPKAPTNKPPGEKSAKRSERRVHFEQDSPEKENEKPKGTNSARQEEGKLGMSGKGKDEEKDEGKDEGKDEFHKSEKTLAMRKQENHHAKSTPWLWVTLVIVLTLLILYAWYDSTRTGVERDVRGFVGALIIAIGVVLVLALVM